MQDKAKASGRIGVHAVSELAPDLAPDYLKEQGFASVPKSVMYGYTASGVWILARHGLCLRARVHKDIDGWEDTSFQRWIHEPLEEAL